MSLSAAKPYPSVARATVLVIIVLALQLLMGIVFRFVFGFSNLNVQTWHFGLINCVALGFVFAWGCLEADEPIGAILPFKRVSMGLFAAMSLSVIGINILLSEAGNFMKSIMPSNSYFERILDELLGSHANSIGVFVLLVVVAPITEEPLFRGLILNGFLNRYAVRWSIVMSAVLFAAMHVNPFQLPAGLALGLLFGWWRVRTRSLWPCLWGHALNNGLAAAIAMFGIRIAGYTASNGLSRVQYQPLWFDLCGAGLTIAGLLLTAHLFRRQPSATVGQPVVIPIPVLLEPRANLPAGQFNETKSAAAP